jgi:hypothetical protein
MAPRRGPQPPSLTYDTASKADRIMRPEAADSIEARGGIAPATGRIDSRIQEPLTSSTVNRHGTGTPDRRPIGTPQPA